MDFIIKRKTLISMLFIAMTMLGYISYKFLPMELFPVMNSSVIYINIGSKTEVDPKYMETQAIIPLEKIIGSIQGVEKVVSKASSNRGSIVISLNNKANDKFTYLKLEEKVNSIKSTLPDVFFITVNKYNLSQNFSNFIKLEVRGEGGVNRIRNIVDNKILSDIKNISGVANATVFGGQGKSLEIIIDKKQCEALNIPISKIQNAITSNSANRIFVGNITEGSRNFFVNISAEYRDINSIENIIVANGSIKLKDISTISFGVKEAESYSRVNGKDIITIDIIKDSQENDIELSHRVIDQVKVLNKKYESESVTIVISSNSAEKIENNINEIMKLALTGSLLAIIILWFFLKNLKIVSIIALAVPISVLTAFNFFYYFGITINTLTLVGIVLAVGMLLDNSIVVLENIYSHYSRNGSASLGTIQGTKEVSRSIIAATLTTITVFVPFIFSNNQVINFIGKNIGVSIISTLLISLLVAFLLIPMLTYVILSSKKNKKSKKLNISKIDLRSRVIQIYIVLLKTCLRNPAKTIITTILIFFITIGLSLIFSSESTKEVKSDRFKIYVTMPVGSTLENTEKVVIDIEKKTKDIPEKKEIVSNIREEQAVITYIMKKDFDDNSKRDIFDIKDEVENRLKKFKQAEIEFNKPESNKKFGGSSGGMSSSGAGGMMKAMGIGSSSEKIVIKGNDFAQMLTIAKELKYYFKDQDYIRRVRLNIAKKRPEVHLNFNTRLMIELGLKPQNVISELRTFRTEFPTGSKYKQGVDEYDIIIKEKEDKTSIKNKKRSKTMNLEDLKKLQISNNKDVTVDLQNISSIYYSKGLGSIKRVNQEKEITLKFSFNRDIKESKALLKSYRDEIDGIIASYNLPAGVALQVVHDESDMSDFYFLIISALILILMILASVFESLTTPIVLLMSIPLAAIGAFMGLLFTGHSIFNNTNSLMGLLILIGIVVNNGIILIDFMTILRKSGCSRERAIFKAGISRIRPITITAITTIIALFPLAMGESEYVEIIGAPFAITVIGGLAVSTLLTLLFIPTFYLALENSLNWFKSLNYKIIILQLLIFAGITVLIYLHIDNNIWKFFYGFLLIIIIPGLTHFIISSFKRTSETLIGKDEPITISINNVVKIYGRESRFSREWNSGINLAKSLGHKIEKQKGDALLWEVPLILFTLYFTYFHIDSGIWLILFSIGLYFSLIGLTNQIINFSASKNKIIKKIFGLIIWGLKYLFPILNCYWLGEKLDNSSGFIILGILWYFAILINNTSDKIRNKNINIERLKGRFHKTKRIWYLFVTRIPIIGKKTVPFKALKGVSFEIKTGMFGLLGPNGAGKSTLMRIICGIFEQSYGKILINGIDTQEKREELQGLIGYLPQEFGMYENMSSWEYLDYQAILRGISNRSKREDRIKYVLESVNMFEQKDELIGSYSGGMKQRIGIAQILLHLPKILVVDEPTAGLDPRERIRFRNLLVELSKNRIVIFSTHIIEDISSSCNKVAVINKGELSYYGNPIEMNKLAKNLAWQLEIEHSEFSEFNKHNLVVHHMRTGDTIKIRCLSKEKPSKNAIQVEPNLEEAYLCLLKM